MGGNPPYLLYLWQKAFDFGFLLVVFQKIDTNSAANKLADNAPSMFRNQNRKLNQSSESYTSLGGDGDATPADVIRTVNQNTRSTRLSFLQQNIFDLKCHIEQLQDKIDDNETHRSVPRQKLAIEDDWKVCIYTTKS